MPTRNPLGWQTVRLGDICDVDWGNTTLTKALYLSDGYPAFSATGMDGLLPFYEHDGQAVIVSAIGARCGKCFFAMGKWTAIKNTIIVKSNSPDVVDERFLFFLLDDENIWPRSGSGQPFIGIGKAVDIRILLPSFPEQKAIAHVLQTVQKAKETRQRELTLERERKATLMEYLFTHGTRDEPTKQTEIGDLPESWTLSPFGEVVEIGGGQVDPRQEPYASMQHVGPENIEPDTGRLLSTMTARECNLISGKYLFTREDVLYSKIRPYLRKAALPAHTGICSADMYAIRPKTNILNREFLYHYLLGESFTRRVIAFQNRTGIPKINREQLGQILMPIPAFREQREIGSVLTACKQKAEALEKEMSMLDELFSALLEELMSGRLSTHKLQDETRLHE